MDENFLFFQAKGKFFNKLEFPSPIVMYVILLIHRHCLFNFKFINICFSTLGKDWLTQLLCMWELALSILHGLPQMIMRKVDSRKQISSSTISSSSFSSILLFDNQLHQLQKLAIEYGFPIILSFYFIIYCISQKLEQEELIMMLDCIHSSLPMMYKTNI